MQSISFGSTPQPLTPTNVPAGGGLHSTEATNHSAMLGMMSGITQSLVKRTTSTGRSSSVSMGSAASLSEAMIECIGSMLTQAPEEQQEEWMQDLKSMATPQNEEVERLKQSFQQGYGEQESPLSSLGIPVPGLESQELQQVIE